MYTVSAAPICDSSLMSKYFKAPNFKFSRDKIIQVIKIAYTAKKKRNLPIYGIKSKDLREFTTTEKDLERGISRIPL